MFLRSSLGTLPWGSRPRDRLGTPVKMTGALSSTPRVIKAKNTGEGALVIPPKISIF